jgi:hypothetical protein
MKRIVSLVAILALTLLVVPVMAGDKPSVGEGQGTFYALSKLPTAESTAPAQMTDDQLAAVEAGDQVGVCVVCVGNVGVNACIGDCPGGQNNTGGVNQAPPPHH